MSFASALRRVQHARSLRGMLAVLAICVNACAMQERIILLPEPGGGPTSLAVDQGGREVLLDRPYAATDLTIANPWPYQATPEEVRGTFGAALAAQPEHATHFTLYFIENSDELTDKSKVMLDEVFANLAKRPVRDVVVVGHTDTVGSDEANDILARKRANTVKAMLVSRGVPAEDVVAIGRGKRQLLVPTPDRTAEPLNRRVEIVVR
ncbi:MAG TPA: OmpA family protein [Casimicrobiaceae bacterium]|nr:OmpA family protein [Casimicrobiaceae bacterium]